ARDAVGHQQVEPRQQRRRLRAHVRPHYAAKLLHLVRIDTDLVLEAGTAALFGDVVIRLLQARAGGVEQPAVVGAAQAVVVRDAVSQRRRPVGATLLDQAVAAATSP